MQVIEELVSFAKPGCVVRCQMPGGFQPFEKFAGHVAAAVEQISMHKAKPPQQKVDLADPARLLPQLPVRRVAIGGARMRCRMSWSAFAILSAATGVARSSVTIAVTLPASADAGVTTRAFDSASFSQSHASSRY